MATFPPRLENISGIVLIELSHFVIFKFLQAMLPTIWHDNDTFNVSVFVFGGVLF